MVSHLERLGARRAPHVVDAHDHLLEQNILCVYPAHGEQPYEELYVGDMADAEFVSSGTEILICATLLFKYIKVNVNSNTK